jgi:hypothetical protein
MNRTSRLDVSYRGQQGKHPIRSNNNDDSISLVSTNTLELQRNALYVLGIASVAGKRLLHRHKLTSTADSASNSNCHVMKSEKNEIFAAKYDDRDQSLANKPSRTTLRKVLFNPVIAAYKNSFLFQYLEQKYQRRQIKIMMTILMSYNSMRKIDRPNIPSNDITFSDDSISNNHNLVIIARTLWGIGGRKRNTRWTCSVMASFLVFLLASTSYQKG